MTFSSSLFLFGMLPWIFVFSFLYKNRLKSRYLVILMANTIFYIFNGYVMLVFVFLYAICVKVFSGLLLKKHNKYLFAFALCMISAPLLYTKYILFLTQNFNALFHCSIVVQVIMIPVGISFFTFEAISLLCDIYCGNCKISPSLVDVILYLSFFPTVVSGPIIRFNSFYDGIRYGRPMYEQRSLERIIVGLAKKVLIADKIAVIADYYFDGVKMGIQYSCLGLWIGSVAFSLQLYFDFSGYSDIAIGIGGLLGFEIKENFDKPYQAKSISDFWRRWHISLSQWFRDYIYIPMGGNRCKISKNVLNLLVVWIITGVWHGADWCYITWGLCYFILLVFEKYVVGKSKIETKWYGHIYTLFLVNLLWVVFRASSMKVASNYIKGMFGINSNSGIEMKTLNFIPYFIFAVLLCMPWNRVYDKISGYKGFSILRSVCYTMVVGLVICAVINSSYAPYIYGNF